jgi:hypothetical protein
MSSIEASQTETTHTVNVEVVNEKVPEDKINIRLLLVNGRRSDVLLSPSDNVLSAKRKIFDSWPNGGLATSFYLINCKTAALMKIVYV